MCGREKAVLRGRADKSLARLLPDVVGRNR